MRTVDSAASSATPSTAWSRTGAFFIRSWSSRARRRRCASAGAGSARLTSIAAVIAWRAERRVATRGRLRGVALMGILAAPWPLPSGLRCRSPGVCPGRATGGRALGRDGPGAAEGERRRQPVSRPVRLRLDLVAVPRVGLEGAHVRGAAEILPGVADDAVAPVEPGRGGGALPPHAVDADARGGV